MKEKIVMLFSNGNSAVFFEGRQNTKLQTPWIVLFLEMLEANGEDPTEFVLQMPNNKVATPFKTSEGSWNWRFE